MSSSIIGRTHCPECGFKAAHVKQGPRAVYRHCPECGAVYHATGEARAAALRAKMRAVDAPAPDDRPSPAAGPTPAPAPEPVPAPPAVPRRRGLFS